MEHKFNIGNIVKVQGGIYRISNMNEYGYQFELIKKPKGTYNYIEFYNYVLESLMELVSIN